MSDVNIPALIAEAVEEARNHVENFALSGGDGVRVTRLADLLEMAAVALEAVTVPTDSVSLTDAEWREFQAIPDQGYSHRHWVDWKIQSRLPAVPTENDELEALAKAENIILHGYMENRDIGEVARKVRELAFPSARLPVPVEPEWEYGVMFPEIRKEASFVGIEDSARYFMGRPANSLDKYARDDDKRVLVRRVPAGPWVPVEGTRGGDGA